MTKRALITGVTGQDGAYLAKLLLDRGYEVYGAHRRSASLNLWRLHELGITDQIRLVPFELLEYSNILLAIDKIKPTEVYNLAAQSFVGLSFEQPMYTADVDGMGVARLLEAIKTVDPSIRFYQASTSEMFGKVQEIPQTEKTPFYPRSPYGVAKLYAHWMTVNYRESYNMHATCGILFNHESPMRGLEFVTRKITSQLALIHHNKLNVLELGNLDAKRDWGFAGDYVEGMYQMLQRNKPEDFVLATNQTHSVREFVELASTIAGFDIEWRGEAEKTEGWDKKTNRVIVRVNPAFYRPAEVELLIGDATHAAQALEWKAKTTFPQLVEMMMKKDLERAAAGLIPC
jgi:GDPmannose 4,6-dehydratase